MERLAKFTRYSVTARLFFGAANLVDSYWKRRQQKQMKHQATTILAEASSFHGLDVQRRGELLLKVGKLLINASDTEKAHLVLESAQQDLESSLAMDPTKQTYGAIASLYMALELVRGLHGTQASTEHAHSRRLVIAEERERHFGLRTVFLEGGSELICQAPGVSCNNDSASAV